MKPFKTILLFTLFFTVSANAQLDKTNWLVGGTGSFNSFTEETQNDYILNNNSGISIIQYKVNQYEISPKIGYFFVDKLASGIIITFEGNNYNYIKTISGAFGGGYFEKFNFSAGIFTRYYFLKKDKNFNILTEINYQMGTLISNNYKGKTDKFCFFIGSEVFFNSSVGMEFLLGYKVNNLKYIDSTIGSVNQNGFQIALGFQIHLQKK